MVALMAFAKSERENGVNPLLLPQLYLPTKKAYRHCRNDGKAPSENEA